jgi:hypothetical protein
MSAEFLGGALFTIWSFWYYLWLREEDRIDDEIYDKRKEIAENKIPNPFFGLLVIIFILPILLHPVIVFFIVIWGCVKYKESKY